MIAKSARYVIRNDEGFYVAHRAHDIMGTYRKYTPHLHGARIYSRQSDAVRVARFANENYIANHVVVPVTCVMMEEVPVAV